MNRIIVLFAVMLIHAVVFAENIEITETNKITGTVVDEQNNPLPGAAIWAVGTTIGTGTNTKGEFNITLKEGSYTLRVSFTGYTPQDIVVNANQTERIRVKLNPAVNGLNEVVVTATRTQKLLKDVPVLTRVISQDDIKKLNPIDIKTVLEYEMPGIQFGRHHGSGLPTFTFQGTEGEYVLFLIDGERVSGEGAANNADFDRFDINDIERIEIIKGAASTLYGSNALGGVVNIITKSANRPVVANVSGRYSNNGEQKYDFSGGTKQNRTSWLSTLSYRQKDAYSISGKDDDGGSLTMRGYEIWQTSHKLKYAFSEKLDAQIKGTFYNNRQTTEDKKQNIYRDYALNAKMNYLINADHAIDFSYNVDDYIKYIGYPESKETPKSKIYDDLTNTFRLNYTGNLSSKHTLSVGLETNLEHLKHYMFEDSTSHHAEIYTAYAQEDWKVTENFNILAGIRADYHSEYNLHVTPKLSIMYKLSDFTFRGGYAAGYRSPSLKELYQEWDHQGWFTIVGNPDLKPEKSHHFSASAEYSKGIFNGSVSSYYNKFKDKISQYTRRNPDKNNRAESVYYNANDAQTTGLDVTAQFRFTWGLMLRGSYSYVNNHQKKDGYNTSSVRPHSATFNAQYNKTFGKVSSFISLNGRWMGEVKNWTAETEEDGVTVTGYTYTKHDTRTIFSLNAGAQFPRGISVNMGFDNLFNFKDKKVTSDQTISPQQGVAFVAAVAINIADFFKF